MPATGDRAHGECPSDESSFVKLVPWEKVTEGDVGMLAPHQKGPSGTVRRLVLDGYDDLAMKPSSRALTEVPRPRP